MKKKNVVKMFLAALLCVSLLIACVVPAVADESLDLAEIQTQLEELQERVADLEEENKGLKARISALEDSKESSDNDDEVNTTSAEASDDIEYIMAAYAIDAAYNSATFPNTFCIQEIAIDWGWVSGSGLTCDRLVLVGYSENSYGGNSVMYVIVIRSETDGFYNPVQLDDGYYYTISVYDSDPGTASEQVLDLATAVSTYQKLYDTDTEIPYDD